MPDDDALVEGCYASYLERDYDYAQLRFLPESQPTIFELQPLTYAQRHKIFSLDTADKIRALVRCGLVSVSGYQRVDRDTGAVSFVELPPRETDPELGICLPLSCLSQACFPDEHLVLLASAVQDISQAKKKRSMPADTLSGPTL